MRILVISQYPIHPAIHGGQKRVSAIVDAYKASHNVRHAAVFWRGSYPVFNNNDDSVHIEITDIRLLSDIRLHPERSDLLLARGLTSQRSKAYTELRSMVKVFDPQLIHIEQPYLVACIKKMLLRMNVTPVIVHGSQNVEYQLKANIYGHSDLSARDLKYLLDNTDQVEKSATMSADINLSVSRMDMRILRGKTNSSPWFIVRNGTEYNGVYDTSTEKDVASILFVGSAHPPNYIGIESMLYDTSYLNKGDHISLVGGVGDYFLSKYNKTDIFWVGKRIIGQVSNEDLQAYIKEADVIILPITTGGGSNLKTAEALCAHKKVVATDFAFRGFEKYKSFPNIYIANSPNEFRKSILAARAAAFKPYTRREEQLIKHLSWKYTLRTLRVVILYTYILLIFRK